jgi:ABC-type dipeptide/oligopeptide/nickel transport system ATPase component
MLLVTHDLGVIAQYCHRVVVMKDSRVVETGPVLQVMVEPRHPYTKALLDAVPRGDHHDQVHRTGDDRAAARG